MPDTLGQLLNDIAACRACAGEFTHTPRPVVRVSLQTQILICGQAPGRRVHESGLPFDDPSGDRLRDWLGVDRQTFYGPIFGVAAMGFCYPGTNPKGGDYPPPPRCAELWRQALMDALPPMPLTLLVGAYSQRWALRGFRPGSVTDLTKDWRALGLDRMPLPHPSWRNTGWLKRNPWFETELVPVLRARVAAILESSVTSV